MASNLHRDIVRTTPAVRVGEYVVPKQESPPISKKRSRRLSRFGAPAAILTALTDNGAMTRDELEPVIRSLGGKLTPREAICYLRRLGLVREAVLITDEGRRMLAEFERWREERGI